MEPENLESSKPVEGSPSFFVRTPASLDTLLEREPTAMVCTLCHDPILHGQVTSGVRLATDEEVVGHYTCVCNYLGPERTLAAIMEGILPALNPKTLVNGRAPGWEKLFGL